MIVSFRNRWTQILLPGLLISMSVNMSVNAQQAVTTSAAPASQANSDSTTTDQIAALKEQLAAQQRQLEELRTAMQKQQEAIEKATQQVNNAEVHWVNTAASLGEVASTTGMVPMPAIVAPSLPPAGTLSSQVGQPGSSESPLGFHIGGSTFTPLGFVDFISVARSTNTGSNLGTGFSGIPYGNTAAGGLSEERFSMQNSRIGFRVDSQYHDYKILGYVETDFLGNAPTNIYITSNSDTLRMRLFFVDIVKDAFEFTGGQTWSLMTPNRKAIGVLPSDLFYSQDIDTNYQSGLTWARTPGVRFTWNPSESFHWAFALENPQQYVGGAVVLPKGFSGTNEVDTSANSASVPNLFPDFITKVAFDGGVPGHAAHLELAGLINSYKTFNSATTGPGANTKFTKAGFGGSLNFNFELAKGFRILSNNFVDDGSGRMIANTGAPDFIIRGDGSISLVHSASTVDGFEYQATSKLLLYSYYGGTYIGRNGAVDQDGKTLIGYGFTGSPNSNNRTVQEATFGITNNFWKSAQYGSLLLAFQYSYLTRSPWSVITPGAPQNALTHMGFVDLRYVLP
jgi:hypothetical protein